MRNYLLPLIIVVASILPADVNADHAAASRPGSLLDAKIHIGVVTSNSEDALDLVASLCGSFPMNIEILRSRDTANDSKSPLLQIVAGEYTVLDLLEKIKAADPAVTWTVTDGAVDVTVGRTMKKIPDCLALRVGETVDLNLTPDGLLSWLNLRDQRLLMSMDDSSGVTLLQEKHKTSVDKNTTARELLNTFSKDNDVRWIATVYDAPRVRMMFLNGTPQPDALGESIELRIAGR